MWKCSRLSQLASYLPFLGLQAGTVMTREQAIAACDAGATFLMAPGTDPVTQSPSVTALPRPMRILLPALRSPLPSAWPTLPLLPSCCIAHAMPLHSSLGWQDLVRWASALPVLFIPGVMTPSEVNAKL